MTAITPQQSALNVPTSSKRNRTIKRIISSVLIILVLSIPYVIAFSNQNENWQFSGFMLFIEDGNSYLGKMRLGGSNDFNFHLFYTSEAHQGVSLTYLFYILTGWLIEKFIPETHPNYTQGLILGYHALRILADLFYLTILWRFIRLYVYSNITRYTAFIFATLGGGIGWLFLFSGQQEWMGGGLGLPPEFYIPEGFSTIVLFGLPHLAIARGSLLLGFLLLFKALKSDKYWIRYSILAGLSWIVVVLCVPFYFAVISALLGVWGCLIWLQKKVFPRQFTLVSVVAYSIIIPVFIYVFVTYNLNPAFRIWSEQVVLLSASPLGYLVGYCLLIGLTIPAYRWAWKKGRTHIRYLLLVGWIVIVPILVYLPLNVQRRLAEGVIVPLAILAAYGVERIANGRRWIIVTAWFVLSLSSIFFLAGSILNSLTLQPLVYLPTAQINAMNWLNQNAPVNAVVLSSENTGSYIPAWTHLRVYVGHTVETLDWYRKLDVVEAFYTGALDPEQSASLLSGECLPQHPDLCSDPIDYVWVGPLERENFTDVNFSLSADWEIIYNDNGYVIYGRTINE